MQAFSSSVLHTDGAFFAAAAAVGAAAGALDAGVAGAADGALDAGWPGVGCACTVMVVKASAAAAVMPMMIDVFVTAVISRS